MKAGTVPVTGGRDTGHWYSLTINGVNGTWKAETN